ncbi:MAG: MarR family transcriptional regulator [Acidimicrobiales bacterium]
MAGLTDPATAVPWLDEAEQDAWRAFITGSRRLLERLDQDLKALGLNHDDYGVLVALSESAGDRMRMAELAEVSVESRSRLSHHIGRLEARGLVTRETCPTDRRGTWAVLTPEGREMIEALAPHHVAGVRRYLLDQVSAEELTVLGSVFARIDLALRGDTEACGPDTGVSPS